MIHISCLPKAGLENPYQLLMMEGLNSSTHLDVKHGIDDKFLGILRTAMRDKPDYIHFDWIQQYYYRRKHWMTTLLYPLFVIQIWLVVHVLGVKLVWTLHNIMPHDSPDDGVYLKARRYFAKKVDWIRVFSPTTVTDAASILSISEDKFIIVPEGSYVSYYPNTTNRESARNKFSISTDSKVVLFFGSIRPYKGIEDLIIAFKNINVGHLIIAGNCTNKSYANSLLDLIGESKSITFHSRGVSLTDIQFYMSCANVVVLPFKKIENSGSAILAMGFSKPIVAPFKGVLPYRLKKQQHLLFKDDLESKLSSVLQMSIEDLDKIGITNFQEVQKFKWVDYEESFK